MRILHTSDWHLGHSLYRRNRYTEFSAFLDWLADTIKAEQVDALLVSGDIFDTTSPGNPAQELYYRFLYQVSSSCCRHVVVIAGNHDSASFLNAPRELLRTLNVFVIGAKTDSLEDEIIVLHRDKQPEAIICAVPYLRDRDILTIEPGETHDTKNIKLVEGLKEHYADVCAIAVQKQTEFRQQGNDAVPIIAMGHLYTSGGKTIDGDGVRDLYIGSLAHIGGEAFPASIDYLALGHLHVPQSVGNAEHMRYCGSPIPMGFAEAIQEKKVVIVVDFNRTTPMIREIAVPSFQPLLHIEGDLDQILAKLAQLRQNGSNAWLEIEYTGNDIMENLRETLDNAIQNSEIEIRRITNRQMMNRFIDAATDDETLDDLNPDDVFQRCLDAYEVPAEEQQKLFISYHEIIKSLQEEDVNDQ